MEISQVFKCPCNGRIYPSLQSLKQHKKTKIHLSWEGSRELRELKKLSKKYNVNISSMALSYCLAQQNVEKVLMGVDSKLQLSENIKSVQLQIDKELVEEIDSINIVNKNLLNPSKWP